MSITKYINVSGFSTQRSKVSRTAHSKKWAVLVKVAGAKENMKENFIKLAAANLLKS